MSLLNVSNMTPAYPKAFGFQIRRLSGYDASGIQLAPMNQTTSTSNQTMIFTFPPNTVINFDKNTMGFLGSTATTAGFASFPKNIECIFRNVNWSANGRVLDDFSGYNHWFNWYGDVKLNNPHMKPRRAILSNGNDQVVPTANVTNVPYVVQQWGGFGGTVMPSMFFTGMIGQLQLRVTLDTAASCLIQTAGATGASYQLSNIYLNIEAVMIDDGHFFQAIQTFLADNGAYIFTWRTWAHTQSQTSAWTQQTAITKASSCVNRIVSWFTQNNPDGELDPVTHQSNVFTRVGTGVMEWTVNLAGKTYPQGYRVKLNDPGYNNNLAYAMNELDLSQDLVGGIDSAITSLAVFRDNFWFAMHNFCNDDSSGENWLSGKELRGQTMPMYFNTWANQAIPAPANVLQVHTFIESTTQMIVKAGQMFDIVE